MADLTPALARASAAIDDALRNAEAKDYDAVMHGEPHEGITSDDLADIALSAALYDPDDPEGLWLYGAAIDAAAASLDATLALPESYIVAVRAAVDAVRAEVLGEGVLMTLGREA